MNHELKAFYPFNYIPSWSRKESKCYYANFLRIHVLGENKGGREHTEQTYFLITWHTRCKCKVLKIKPRPDDFKKDPTCEM